MDTSRRGTWVIVRCYGNEAKRVRVWEEDANVVWIHNDEQYRRHTEELVAHWPVGFRREAVYWDNPELFELEPEDEFWDKLRPFSYD